MSDVAAEPEAPVEEVPAAEPAPESVQGDPGDEQPVESPPEGAELPAASPAPPPSPPGSFAVFEHTAASWFDDLESAQAHAYEQAAHRPEGVGGALPVVAEVVNG